MKHFAMLLMGVASAIAGCGGDDSSGSGASAAGNVSVTLLSPALSSRRDVTLSDCSPNFGSGPVSGKCFTPHTFTAKAIDISLGANFHGNTPPGRLIQMNATEEDTGLEGPFGVLGLANFDFSSTATVTNQYSEDNLADSDTSETIYDFVGVRIGAAEMQIEIPSANSNVTNRFWTIRYVFGPQNPTDHSSFASCPEASTRDAIATDGDLYSAPTGFQQGDVLVCQKSTQSASCADSDFQFVSSTDGTLSTSRPSSPVALGNSFWFTTPSCEETDGHPNMEFGTTSFNATLTSAMKIVKDQIEDEGSEPYYRYTVTPDCNTTSLECSGTQLTASKITVSVSFDLSDGVFAHSDVDLESDSEANILKNLTKVLPKNFYASNNATGFGDVTQNLNINATVTVTETSSRQH